jgi:hypothetical protein
LTPFSKAEGGTVCKLMIEVLILALASKQADGGKLGGAVAQADTGAIALKVKYAFVAKPGERIQEASSHSQARADV